MWQSYATTTVNASDTSRSNTPAISSGSISEHNTCNLRETKTPISPNHPGQYFITRAFGLQWERGQDAAHKIALTPARQDGVVYLFARCCCCCCDLGVMAKSLRRQPWALQTSRSVATTLGCFCRSLKEKQTRTTMKYVKRDNRSRHTLGRRDPF